MSCLISKLSIPVVVKIHDPSSGGIASVFFSPAFCSRGTNARARARHNCTRAPRRASPDRSSRFLARRTPRDDDTMSQMVRRGLSAGRVASPRNRPLPRDRDDEDDSPRSWFPRASDWSHPRRIAPVSQDAIMKKRQTAIEEAYAAQVRSRASPHLALGPLPPRPASGRPPGPIPDP